MEIQLQELIDKIKKNGVAVAEAEAAAILEKARAEADKILADAQAEADAILLKTKEDCDRTVRTGEDALRQAGRNLLISFRESVTRELESVIGDAVSATYSTEKLATLIASVVEARAKDGTAEDLSVLLNIRDAEAIEGALLSALKARMLEGVTLRVSDRFEGGFRIAVDNGRAYYDYSAEAVTELLSTYLNPKVTALLKEVGRV